MTEGEWAACTDPKRMLEHLRGRASDRKLLQFTAACARALGRAVGDPRARDEAARPFERFADGEVPSADVVRSLLSAGMTRLLYSGGPTPPPPPPSWSAYESARVAAREVTVWFESGAADACDLIRELVGNPFRPAAVPPDCLAWRGGAVRALARAIDADRTFHRLPELADALQQAGCSDPAVLAHARAPGPHLRGCWLVDTLLERA